MADKFKVKAVRSFRARINGTMTTVNPGDVVELENRDDYLSVLSTLRAEKADERAEIRIRSGYVPDYKKDRLGIGKTGARAGA